MNAQTHRLNVKATGTGSSNRFVTFAGTQAAIGDSVLGVSIADFAAGETFVAEVVGATEVTSGGAITVGQWVVPDAEGRAIANDGTAPNLAGRALKPVPAAGHSVAILIR